MLIPSSSLAACRRRDSTLDASGSTEEAADSNTHGNISSGVNYGESGADSFNISSDARKASIYGGAQNDSVIIGGSLSSGLVEGAEGADTFNLADLIKSTVKGGADADLVSDPLLRWFYEQR